MRTRNVDICLAVVVLFSLYKYCSYMLGRSVIADLKFDYRSAPQGTASSYFCEDGKNITLQEYFDVVPVSSDNVFMIWPLQPLLMFRALCAAESWAFNHPNMSVWFTFTVNELPDPDGIGRQLMEIYPNLKFIYVDIDKLFEGTPVSALNRRKAWEESKWPGTHLSDLMRQPLVWHKGGYYTDSDVYIVKPINNFRNFMSVGSINADPMLFHNDAKHPWVNAFMETQARDYRPDEYAWNGPGAGRITGKRLCGLKFLRKDEKGQVSDCTFEGATEHFLGRDFCPHPVKDFLKPDQTEEYEKLVGSTVHAFHATNVHTRYIFDTFTSGSLLQNAAKRNCPFIFDKAQQNSNFW